MAACTDTHALDTTLAINTIYHYQTVFVMPTGKLFTDQHSNLQVARLLYPLTLYLACDVCRGRHKPLIGQRVTETTAGQTQHLLIVLSTTDVMWFMWHIVSADTMNGRASVSGDCRSHEQKLYC